MYKGIKCFRKRDIQLFIKLLRKRLSDYNLTLKYLVSSEYGEKFGRPHYHALFFVYGTISPFLFYRMVENCWCVVIRQGNSYEYKSRGFVKYGDNLGLITGSSGISYVTKYIVKDVSYTSQYLEKVSRMMISRYSSLILWLEKRYDCIYPFTFSYRSSDGVVEQNFDVYYLSRREYDVQQILTKEQKDSYRYFLNKVRKQISTRLPFHLQSTQLGISALDGHKPSERTFDSLPIVTNRGTQYYKLPRYLKRRLWYECVENETDFKRNRFILTQEGINKWCFDLERKIQTSTENYAFMLRNFDDVGCECMSIVNKSLASYNLKFENIFEFEHFVNNMDIDVRVLSLYEHIFRYRVCPFSYDDVSLTESFLKNNYREYVYTIVHEVGRYDYGYIKDYPQYMLLCEQLWNFHPFFARYEICLLVFEAISLSLRNQSQRVLNEAERNERYLRQLFRQKDPLSCPF